LRSFAGALNLRRKLEMSATGKFSLANILELIVIVALWKRAIEIPICIGTGKSGITKIHDIRALEKTDMNLVALIRNAIEVMKDRDNRLIELSAVQNTETGIKISVRDNGTSIDQENLDQIFVPLYSTRKEGSGIGLSLSRQIMKLHKGRIEVESEKGTGTCCNLEF